MTASTLERFSYDGRELRSVLVDGEPWFVAADVAEILGYDRSRNALRMLDEDEKGAHSVSTPGGDQSVQIVSESGLYSLILRSRLNGAVPFRRWVTGEVLPALRRNGSYTTGQQYELPRTYAEALRELAGTVEELDRTRGELAEATPKAEAYDSFLDADGYLSVAATAKALGYGPNVLFRRLRQLGVLQGNNLPYQQYAHHFAVIPGTYVNRNTGETHVTATTKVRPSGVDFLRRKVTAADERAATTGVVA